MTAAGKDQYGRICATSSIPVTPPGLSVPPTGLTASAAGGLTVSWTAPNSSYYLVTGYNLSGSAASGGPWTALATGVPGTTYTGPAGALGGVVYIAAASVNAVGAGPLSTPVSVNLPPAPPTGLKALSINAAASLSWNASPGATSYTVKVGGASGGPYSTNQTVAGTSATVSGLKIGTPFYFVVTATGPAGTSAQSAPVALTVTSGINSM